MLLNRNCFKYLKNLKKYRNYCTNKIKYTDTILLPKTDFPQRLVGKKLLDRNKRVHEVAAFDTLYKIQKQRTKNGSNIDFILHDGPPYANGKPHMGHMINKILKDIINRSQIINGKTVHYIPGWDCHGLPIELKALKSEKNSEKNPIEIRKIARDFATKTIEEQSKIFQSWGVMGDWKNSYLTYSIPYIKNQFQQFFKLYSKKLVYRDFKPVFWSPSSKTALAEAELQYNDTHISKSVYLKLKLEKIPEVFRSYGNDFYALVWTTTPWTLPSNQAVCFNPELQYSLVKIKNYSGVFLVASELIGELSKTLKTEFEVLENFSGNILAEAKYRHPIFKTEVLPFLPGSHATATKGTGLVHTAPAHGPEDFLLALNHKIPVKCIVNEDGKYNDEYDFLKGLDVLTNGNEKILSILQDDILHVENFVHSYPYDWRTKKPIILRASQQWFIDTNALKNRAIEILDNVIIVPERGSENYKQNLITQIKKRPFWCISRQRVWGVPIPVFFNKDIPLITEGSINHLCNLLDKNGPDFWWKLDLKDLVSPDLLQKNDISSIKKGSDIFDIWFDSGISWSFALENDQVADLYLEGVDQFNGWFQSSLMTSVGIRDKAPYKKIYVHGFAVDEKGFKMSKSVGNVVDPQELIEGGKKQNPMGIDPLRWWVACHASQDSLAFVSKNILQSSQDEVQKIRNTLRFALGAISDFRHLDYEFKNLKTIDKYLLHLIYEFNKEVTTLYEEYHFNKLCKTVINFVTNPVSALYYSIIKDRLYCNSKSDLDRNSAQFVLTVLLETVCKAIYPILPHLSEEINMHRMDKICESFYKSEKIKIAEDFHQPRIAETVEQVLNIKKYINKQFSNTLDLNVEITGGCDIIKILKGFETLELIEIFQIAEFSLVEHKEMNHSAYNLNITKTAKILCPRCRRFNSEKTNELCNRCFDVLENEEKIKKTG